jgi:hypothetical protein
VLAGREVGEAGRRRRGGAAGELGHEPPRHGGREDRGAVGDDADRGQELRLRGVLEQEAAGAGAQRLVHDLVEIEGREHEHPRRLRQVLQAPRGLEAVDVGHAHVHQHDVGPQLGGARHGHGAICGLADNLDVGLRGEDHAEPGAHQRLVVGDQHADHPAAS